MIAFIEHSGEKYKVDLDKPIDLSIPLGHVKCFNAPDVRLQPYKSDDFVGSVKFGAPVNFFNVELNPHGNGTHTECLGHITQEQESINSSLKTYHFIAKLVSVKPENKHDVDHVISLEALKQKCQESLPEAIIIRTLPNNEGKLTKDYSATNPAYLSDTAMAFLVEKGVKHLLIDLPSVDKEEDEGLLVGHHLFWKLEKGRKKEEARKNCTITELIYVDNSIKDGFYLLNLQIAPFELDASQVSPLYLS